PGPQLDRGGHADPDAGRRHGQRHRRSQSPPHASLANPSDSHFVESVPMTEESSPITPTAHYTAAVWARNGLSHPALSTTAGRLMFESTRPTMALFRALGGTKLEDQLLARHRLIDRLLDAAIDRGEVTQVIEIAAGLSPRGWRFTRNHGER